MNDKLSPYEVGLKGHKNSMVLIEFFLKKVIKKRYYPPKCVTWWDMIYIHDFLKWNKFENDNFTFILGLVYTLIVIFWRSGLKL